MAASEDDCARDVAARLVPLPAGRLMHLAARMEALGYHGIINAGTVAAGLDSAFVPVFCRQSSGNQGQSGRGDSPAVTFAFLMAASLDE